MMRIYYRSIRIEMRWNARFSTDAGGKKDSEIEDANLPEFERVIGDDARDESKYRILNRKPDQKKAGAPGGLDRMVETLIQKAMSHGELENLPGAGKPLKPVHDDPFTDSTTKKINEIMIREGAAADWIMYQREIREEIGHCRILLEAEAKLSSNSTENYKKLIEKLRADEKYINKKIEDYNFAVPALWLQKGRFELDRMAERIWNESRSGKKPNDLIRNF